MRRLTINYLPVSANFLQSSISNNQQTTPQPLTFMPEDETDSTNTRAKATLSVPLDNDDTVEENGTIMVTLQPETPNANTTYKVHATNNNATVQVEDDDAEIPVLAIEGPLGATVESALCDSNV